ncbi:MAG: HAD family hydrolase [Bacteroidota bacterium]|jgi:FMN phosphatase YigB (HAD superfamily)|nr:HAD family phosphatase [Saprospiraceae bacterium]
MIKNVIFDFGNVLFDLDLPSIERNLQQLMGSGFEQAREKLLRNRVFELYETGGMTSAEFLDHIRMSAPEPPAPEVVRDIWNSIFLEMPAHRFTMLQELRQKYKVFLLSNINELHERWIADYMVRVHGIHDYESRYFDGVYFSHLIRLRKPDTAIYEYVLADAELNPAESVFFDDVEANIEGARTVGITAFLHPVGSEIADHVKRVLPV